jgi:tRNA-Thr(GGU) m(6)t(6)A37 methyltransferase TsaA
METIRYHPIGTILSPFKGNVGVPRQAVGALEVSAQIEIFDEFSKGLKDLEGFSHIVVVFHLHLVKSPGLTAHPPWDGQEHGVFATRSPYRPNPIGISIVCLERVTGNILQISGVDMVDGSPVLDIKPYIPDLNPAGEVNVGWLAGKKTEGMIQSRSGDR